MTITATQFKKNLGYYLALAKTEDIVITKNRKPIAKLVNPFAEKLQALDAITGILSDEADMTIKEARAERLADR